MDNLVLEVNDYLAINKAKIEINKINVVGGVNSSGKSTLSKIFYSLLKGNSAGRKEYALQYIIDDINESIDKLNHKGNGYDLPRPLKINDNYAYIIKRYNEVLELCKNHQKMAGVRLVETTKEMDETLNNLIKKLENDGFDVKGLKSEYKFSDKDLSSLYSDDVAKAIREYGVIAEKFYPIFHFCKEMANYESIINFFDFECEFLLTEEMQEYFKYIHKFNDLQSLLFHLWESMDDNYPIFDFKRKMDLFIGEDSPDLSRMSLSEIFDKEQIFDKFYPIDSVYGIHFELYMNYIDSKIDAFDYFFDNGFISSVYYVDSISLIDLSELKQIEPIRLFHNNEILKDIYVMMVPEEVIFKSDIFQNRDFPHGFREESNLDNDVENILEKIENIIHGHYDNHVIFVTDKKIKDKFSRYNHIIPIDTASGIKQIGIIQLLLMNDKLKKDGYLIIDEPEVNLHPDWQFKFAEILVLLARDLNITVYLNTHSPFFIEAIDAFTEFYDMQEDINYYLTEESEAEGKYDFTKISSDELYRIYDNLGNAYDLIDQLRLEKHLGE